MRVAANGLSFEALEWGPADGPLVLCLHGYPDTAWTWRRVGPLLAGRGLRVVAPFMRGYGPTDLAPDGDYGVGALAADAVALRWALAGDDGPAVLVGHDWGAAAAYAVPGGVFDRVVTLAVPPPETLLRLRPDVAVRQLRRSWYMAFQQLPVVSERSLGRLLPKLWRDWSPGYDATKDLEHLWRSLDTPERRTAALSYYRALRPRQMASFRSLATTYLHGARDGCVLPEAAHGAILVEGAGHFIQLERPDVVAGYVSP